MDGEESSSGAAIEMASRTTKNGHSSLVTDDFVDEEVVLEVREPFAWADNQMRRQNRCFFFALVALVIGASVYVVGGVYSSEEGALEGDKYNAESGILNNEFDSAKAQDLFEKEHDTTNGRANPFGNQNAIEHGNSEALDKLRWSATHQGEPYPGDKVKGHPGGKDKIGGHKGGHQGAGAKQNGGLRPGGNARPNGNKPGGNARPNGGGGSGGHLNKPNAGRPNGNGKKPNPGGRPNGGGGAAGGHDKANNNGHPDRCDFSEHADWLDATVTLDDGVKYEVVEKFDHDHTAFVQGLTYAHGTLWESNGLYGKSTVRILDPDTADVIKSVDMPNKLFGEGMAYWRDKLYQITWKSQKGFIYNATTLEVIDQFKFHTTTNQGWGITWDPCGKEFVVTDGSPNLHFWDKETLSQKRKIAVTRMDGSPAEELNEIEWWRGKILANVWFKDVLLVIDPETGTVEKEYDFSSLFPKKERAKIGCDVFNGISVSSDPDILYVTGKKWDRMFKVRLLS